MNWEEIADFAQQEEKWLKKYLGFPNGIPYSDTIRVVAGNINAAYFYQTDKTGCYKGSII